MRRVGLLVVAVAVILLTASACGSPGPEDLVGTEWRSDGKPGAYLDLYRDFTYQLFWDRPDLGPSAQTESRGVWRVADGGVVLTRGDGGTYEFTFDGGDEMTSTIEGMDFTVALQPKE